MLGFPCIGKVGDKEEVPGAATRRSDCVRICSYVCETMSFASILLAKEEKRAHIFR